MRDWYFHDGILYSSKGKGKLKAMATKFFKFYGTAKWAKVGADNYDKEYDCWGINLYADQPSKDAIKASGVQLRKKNDEDGDYWGFRRKRTQLMKGDTIKLDPPKVTDKLGRPLDALIGNGSEVAITVSVFDTKKGKGHRLESVEVLNLVEYGGGVVDAREGYEMLDKVVQDHKKTNTQHNQPNDELPF